MKPKVTLLALPYDKTSSFGKGADKGPQAILDCFNTQLEVYDRISKSKPSEETDITQSTLDITSLQPEDVVKEVSQTIEKQDNFTISIGGEHSVTTGILQGLSKKHSPKDITIIQIDAHLDLRDTDEDYNKESPSKHAHSCCMKRALDLGYNIISVGVRAYADFELQTAQDNNIPVFEWPQDEHENLIPEILGKIQTDNIYITLDVDGIDPSHMPATGTPVQGGLSWKFTNDLLKTLFAKKNVIAADLVEVAPIQNSKLTEYGAAQLIYSMIGLKNVSNL